MISQQIIDLAKNIVNEGNGYDYYLLYSNTNIGNNYWYDEPSAYLVVSDKPIVANSRYNYSVSGNSATYSIITTNASERYNTERISVTTATHSKTVDINKYEFVYTNAEFDGATLQPDFNATRSVTAPQFQGFSLIIGGVILLTLLTKIFNWGR